MAQFIGKTVKVELSDDCVRFGGRNEYPDGWTGIEMSPVAGDTVEVSRKAYYAAGPFQTEGLTYVRFGRPFIVMVSGKDGKTRPETKTDRRNGMWIPRLLVVATNTVAKSATSPVTRRRFAAAS